MPFTLAVIADTHLTPVPGTAQHASLHWALATLASRPPDLLVIAGDVTAAGSPEAARALREALKRAGLPVLVTPGNSDRRDAAGRPDVLAALATARSADYGECRVVLVDSSEGVLPPAERAALRQAAAGAGERALVVVSHCPPEALAPESRQWLETWVRQARPSLLVAAHLHRDVCTSCGGAPLHLVRGLDPDKAIGGPPALALFTLTAGAWRRSNRPFPGGTVAQWSPAEREEFRQCLSLACSRDAVGGLLRAAAEGVAGLELRATEAAAAPALPEALQAWRSAGGRSLSWHMPDVPWQEEAAAPGDTSTWEGLLRLGLQSDSQALTVHVPRVSVRHLSSASGAWHGLAGEFARLLQPAVARGVQVRLENMHMTVRDRPDDSRRYGYLPEECLAWLGELRSRLGDTAVGMLLDLGHARNNEPFSATFPLGTWYALVGREARAYHVHQVVQREGRMHNHQPLTAPHGPLISLSSFLWAWREGQLTHGPIFLEIPGAEGQLATLRALREMLQS